MMNTILIQIPGCNEFTEKFPGGSPNAAIELAAIRYPNALRIEWKGSCRTDAEDAAAAKREADYNRQVQETYARQSAQTAANWEHQRQLDARDHAAPSYATAPRRSSGGGGGLFALVIAVGIGFIGVNHGVAGFSAVFEGFAEGFNSTQTEQVVK